MEYTMCCPLCRGDLTRTASGFVCTSNHCFDRAAKGYTNLLLGNQKGQHGDNRDMILARRRFLDGGWYAPLKDALQKCIREAFPQNGVLLDAGCGECYYTHHVLLSLQDKGARGYGIDISKDALRFGGVRETVKNGTLSLFAAGVYDMPVKDNSVDAVMSVFAPLSVGEYARVLKPGGRLYLVYPDVTHLLALKEVLYETPVPNKPEDNALPGFREVETKSVKTVFTLPGQDAIQSLFMMTPYYYRTPKEGKERLETLKTLTVEAAFVLAVYEKPDDFSKE